MLFRFLKYVQGYVEVALWGYAPERFFNLCSNHGIVLWNLHRQDGVYYFRVSVRGFHMLRPLLKKTRTHIRICKKNGVPFFMHRYRKRKLLFSGIVLCMLTLYALSQFIWKVNINGNDYVTDDSILSFLKEQKCSYGTAAAKIDCAKLEEALYHAFDQVIWTSIKREGTTLTIDIQENLVDDSKRQGEALPQKLEDAGYDLLAVRGGVVKKLYVRQGVPMVQPGDKVKKGDVLVSGAVPVCRDDGALAAYRYCVADADLELRTVYHYKKSFRLLHEDRVYIGESKVRHGLLVLDHYMELPKDKEPFPEYSITETRRQLKLGGSFYLPVSFVCRTYEAYQTVQQIYSKKQAEAKAKDDLNEFLEKLTQKGVLILKKNVMINIDENVCQASGNIEVLTHAFRYAKNHSSLDERNAIHEPE